MKNWYRHTDLGSHLSNARMVIAGFVATAILFASCQSVEMDLPATEQAPILTQFSLSLPHNGYTSRMSDEIMQSDGTFSSFRGIEDIWLIPFATSNAVANNSMPIGTAANLFSIVKPTSTNVTNSIPSTCLIASNNAVLFDRVNLPTDTRTMLFYGRAVEADIVQSDLPTGVTLASLSENDLADARNHKNGILLHPDLPMDLSTSASSLTFALKTITSNDAASTESQAMITYLNDIVTALRQDNLINNPDVRDFLDNKAGSSPNVRALVQDLYRALHGSANATNALAAIRTGFQDIDNDNDVDDNDVASSSAKLTASLDKYPAKLYLPDGSAAIEYVDISGTPQFRAITGGVSFGEMQIAPPRIYAYPPALYYRGNSPIRTSKVSQQDNYVSTNTWNDILSEYGNEAGIVKLNTRSVALEEPVQYAVGRLDINVQTDDGDIPDHNGNTVSISAQGFPLTAVLVGNQSSVNYLFNAYLEAEALTIYDTAVGTVYAPRAASAGSYAHATSTLVLQTPSTKDIADLTLTPKHKSYVALEFVNNTGKSFVGHDGQIIPEGCHFYLIGELDPTKLTGYDINDEVKSRVFTQDRVTTVNFTITSLADAYNVIPDLRVSELRISLRIDTNWQVGYHFTDNVSDTFIEIHQ